MNQRLSQIHLLRYLFHFDSASEFILTTVSLSSQLMISELPISLSPFEIWSLEEKPSLNDGQVEETLATLTFIMGDSTAARKRNQTIND